MKHFIITIARDYDEEQITQKVVEELLTSNPFNLLHGAEINVKELK